MQWWFENKGNFYCAELKPEMKENSSAEEHWEVWKTAFEVFAWVKQFKCLKDDQNLCNKR